MRHDKLAQRLKSRRDSFDFNALIAGVSTLVEEKKEEEQAGTAEVEDTAALVTDTAPAALPDTSEDVAALDVVADAEPQPEVAFVETIEAVEIVEAFESIEAVAVPSRPEPETTEEAGRAFLSPPVPLSPSPSPPLSLAAALEALSSRMTQEAVKMGTAMQRGDAEEAGFYLAHVNQILELLRTLDPRGDVARQSRTTNAPPPGRGWLGTAWTVVEFAESPWSALLPSDSDDVFVCQMLYAAWGVVFEPL